MVTEVNSDMAVIFRPRAGQLAVGAPDQIKTDRI